MGKYALLIGVDNYGEGLRPLPAATSDVTALREVLLNSEMGGFDEAKSLSNPMQSEMAREVELWFQDRQPEDLVLLFFSGHGVKDDRRDLYFAAANTEKQRDYLVRSTAISARFIHECISRCKAKHQVIILDCCFSGAFGDLVARDDGEINLKEQLGAEGRVVLTSTSAVDYSFEEKDADLSIYTRYLVEGIATGAADDDGDGVITVDELHSYAGRKVKETSAIMSPEMITLKGEGFRIRVAKSLQNNPKLRYRQEAEKRIKAGRISPAARHILEELRTELNISILDSQVIEIEVLRPYFECKKKRRLYKGILKKCLQENTSLSGSTIEDLVDLQKKLGIKSEDAALIVEQQKAVSEARKRLGSFNFDASIGPDSIKSYSLKNDFDQQARAIEERFKLAMSALNDAILIFNDDLEELHGYRKEILNFVVCNYELAIQNFKETTPITENEMPALKSLVVSETQSSEPDTASIYQEKMPRKKRLRLEKIKSEVDTLCTQIFDAVKTYGIASREIQHTRLVHEVAFNQLLQHYSSVSEILKQNKSLQELEEEEVNKVNYFYRAGETLKKLLKLDFMSIK